MQKKTEGYSGDDLKNLVRKVKFRVAKHTEVIVTMDDFDNVLEKFNRERQNLKDEEKKVGVESRLNTVRDVLHKYVANQNVSV